LPLNPYMPIFEKTTVTDTLSLTGKTARDHFFAQYQISLGQFLSNNIVQINEVFI